MAKLRIVVERYRCIHAFFGALDLVRKLRREHPEIDDLGKVDAMLEQAAGAFDVTEVVDWSDDDQG